MVVMVVYIFCRRQYAIRMQLCSRLQLAKTRFFLPSKWKIFHLSLARWSTVVSKQQKAQIMFKNFFSTICQQYFCQQHVCPWHGGQLWQQEATIFSTIYIHGGHQAAAEGKIMFNNIFAFSGQRKPAAPPWPEGIRKNEPPYTISNKCNCTKI